MTEKALQAAFDRWREQNVGLVLASVFETEGSTYSKAGARMLITADGDFQGMLSGGCLEGDLAERARSVLETNEPQAVTYDLGQNDEELWGLGVGCDGLMRIFLQPLAAATGYEPFTTMSRALAGADDQVAATVLDSGVDGLRAGGSLVTEDGVVAWTDIDSQYLPSLEAAARDALATANSQTVDLAFEDGAAKVLLTLLRPPPRILVLGGGLDAQPVVRLATELGWRVTVQDHRPAYISAGDFAIAEAVHCLPVAEMADSVELEQFAAAIVMSHHLDSDRLYLGQLATSDIPYIGLLGPRDRRRRLMDELGDAAASLEPRIHGPAGIDIGGRGPAAIALSIIAEMHRALERAGRL